MSMDSRFALCNMASDMGIKNAIVSPDEVTLSYLKGRARGTPQLFQSDEDAGYADRITFFGGGGKSIEHPVLALKGAGVKAVIVESCSRYFFRNAINNGLPILICEGITEQVKNGDELEVNVSTGEILNVTTGLRFPSNPLPENLIEILNLGGYIPYTRKKMESLTEHGSLSN